MSKRAFDMEGNMVIEASATTPRKRYYCLGDNCPAEMHLVIREDEAHFSAYSDTPHNDTCPYQKNGTWVQSVLPPNFNIIDFYLDTLDTPDKSSTCKSIETKPKFESPKEDLCFVRSLSGLTKFCLSHSFDTLIDSSHTVGSLCVTPADVNIKSIGQRDLKLLVGNITRIDSKGHFVFFDIKNRITDYCLQSYVYVEYQLAWDLLNKIKKKYPKFPSTMRNVPAAILCDCCPDNKTTTYYNGWIKHTSASGALFNLKHIYIF